MVVIGCLTVFDVASASTRGRAHKGAILRSPRLTHGRCIQGCIAELLPDEPLPLSKVFADFGPDDESALEIVPSASTAFAVTSFV